jgi:hypothetical protein
MFEDMQKKYNTSKANIPPSDECVVSYCNQIDKNKTQNIIQTKL